MEDPEFAAMYLRYHRDTLIEPARTRGYGIEAGRNLSDLELLAKLQHFGAETGLIDFTWSPLVALWFASADPRHEGKVFLVDTSYPIGIAKIAGSGSDHKLHEMFTAPRGGQPILYWEPTGSGDAMARILRQRSVFVIGRPLATQTSGAIEEITIERTDKEELLGELEVIDFNEATLFQDVYGFAQASKSMRIQPLSAGALQRRANRYYQSGEYEKAIDDYDQSIQAEPSDGLTYLLRANVLAALERYAEAIDDYDRADGHPVILQRGLQDVVFYNRGNSKAELGDLQGAIGDYTEAIRVDPTTPQFYYNRGNAYLDLYRFQEALNDFGVASNLDGPPGAGEINYLFNQGIALLATGRLPEALDVYRQASMIERGHEGVHQNLWATTRITTLVQGLDYSLQAVPSGDTKNIVLQFSLPEGYEPVGRELRRLILFGRAGNTGNTGGPGLHGGEGFGGKSFILVNQDTEGQ